MFELKRERASERGNYRDRVRQREGQRGRGRTEGGRRRERERERKQERARDAQTLPEHEHRTRSSRRTRARPASRSTGSDLLDNCQHKLQIQYYTNCKHFYSFSSSVSPARRALISLICSRPHSRHESSAFPRTGSGRARPRPQRPRRRHASLFPLETCLRRQAAGPPAVPSRPFRVPLGSRRRAPQASFRYGRKEAQRRVCGEAEGGRRRRALQG